MCDKTATKCYDQLLVFSAAFGKDSEVKRFLKLGVDVNATNRGGFTPLMAAVCQGRTSTVKLLLDAGAAVDFRSTNTWDVVSGKTALMEAALFGEIEIGELLLKAGADVNAKDSMGYTPLITAANRGKPETIKMLLRYGADKTTKVTGMGAIDLAILHKYQTVVELLHGID